MPAKAVATVEPISLTPAVMLAKAVTSGADVTVIEKMMGLQERWESNQALKSYNAAIGAARSEIPVIIKTNEKTGAGGAYKYESFPDVARVVDPILASHGLSYRFESNSTADLLTVTCVISHVEGHCEKNSLSARPSAFGSSMNAIQALGSAVTYLQRYTLKLALGIATSKDDDGASAGPTPGQGVSDITLGQETLSKAKSRPIYDALIKEMREFTSKTGMTQWAMENTARIYSMHNDFQKWFRDEYGNQLTAISEGVTEDGTPLKQQLKASLEAEDAVVE